MCGRTALALEPEDIRQYLERSNLLVNEWVDQERYFSTYNVAPTYWQPVVRARRDEEGNGETSLILQTMKWGLIPSWTKKMPDYTFIMRTINARDDSLTMGKPMFNSMKGKKRCIIPVQGFYEWLKPNATPKEKIPYFMKRDDGQIMLLAGLYDAVRFEDEEPLYTYTIITTDASKQLSFLHDRMPVILENGSKDVATWLDPNIGWVSEVANLLKPKESGITMYPVDKAVGKVGNNSPDFIQPAPEKPSIQSFFTPKPQKNKKSSSTDPATDKVLNVKDEELTTKEAKAGTISPRAKRPPKRAHSPDTSPNKRKITAFFSPT